MSLDGLRSELQRQIAGDDHVVHILKALLAASMPAPPAIAELLTQQLEVSKDLSVSAATLAPGGSSSISLTGTSDVLGLTGASLHVTFTTSANSYPDIQVVVTPANEWSFGASFPQLSGTAVDKLTLLKPVFVFTTAKSGSYAWTDGAGTPQTSPLSQGLNFIADLVPNDVLGLLSVVVQGGTSGLHLPLAGSIDTAPLAVGEPSPNIAVQAPLGRALLALPAGLGLEVGTPAVTIAKQPGVSDGPGIVPRVFVSIPLIVNRKQLLTIAASVSDQGQDLSFLVEASDGGLSLEQIASLVLNQPITEKLPDFLRDAFETIGFKSFQLDLLAPSMEPFLVGVTVGTIKPWHIADIITVNDTTLAFVVFDPLGRKRVMRSFTADITLFPELPELFPGKFDLLVEDSDDGGVLVSAEYHGDPVSLTTLVSKLSEGEIPIPSDFPQVEFEDFGVSFTQSEGGWDWQMYGKTEATFSVPLASGQVEASLMANVASVKGQKTYKVIGSLNIGKAFFSLEVDIAPESTLLTGTWAMSGGASLGVADLFAALKLPPPELPKSIDLALTSAELQYDFNAKSLVVTATSATYGKAAFVTVLDDNKNRQYFFLLGIDAHFSLSNLPLVGADLSKLESITIGGFRVIISSTTAVDEIKELVVKVNGLINENGTGYPNLPDYKEITGKLLLHAEIDFGTETLPLNLSLGGSSSEDSLASELDPPALVSMGGGTGFGGPFTDAPSSDPTTWFDVQKSYGPVSIARIGVLYQSSQQALWFELDATLAFGPLSLSLVGLGIGSPVKTFEPEFSLQGLGVSYVKPPLEIAGALVNLAPPGAKYFEFEGGIIISTSELTLEVFGYYGNANGFSSMFIFGDLAYPIGGPPAFFVTGMALGFGYNSDLRLPTIDEVASFPFVQALVPAGGTPPFGPDSTPLDVLNVIRNTTPPWVSEKAASLWFGAGITFTSFELVNSKAMLFVEVGDELVIALIGESQAQFPQQVGEDKLPVYANIELDFEVRFAPAEGVFSAQAVLASSSFLLDPSCALTGGFAFFVWYGDSPHAGDFVLTLGGYNPGFTPPSYYPTVPIVGFHWSMDSTITISGGAYFALTPAAMMAGGRLDATYQSGNLKAWFDAHTDAIVRWKPFWFDIEIGITIGASYNLDLLFTSATISVELGCDLELWGPPTGGTVTVNWYIISFTIPFGTPKASAQTIKGWGDVEAMLPNSSATSKPRNVLALSPTAGLTPAGTSPVKSSIPRRLAGSSTLSSLPETSVGERDGDPADPPWLVRGSEFAFTASTPIPVTTATVGGTYAFNGSTFNVFPLGWVGVTSRLTVKVTDTEDNDRSSAFEVALLRSSVPASLWGSPSQTDDRKQQVVPSGSNQLVPDQITGVSVSVNPPQIGSTAGPVDVQSALEFEDLNLPKAKLPLSESGQPTGDKPVNSGTTIKKIAEGIDTTNVAGARDKIFTALGNLKYAPDTRNDPMKEFAKSVGCAFAAEPLLVS